MTMALNVGELTATLKLDSSNFDKGLAQAESAANKGGGFLSNVLSTATGFLGANVFSGIVGGFKDIAGSMISGNAEFETYQTQFGVLLGSAEAAKERLADLAKFGATTPFELPEVVRADKILQSFGLHSQESADRFGMAGEDIRKMVGDTAAGTGAGFEEIALYMGKLSTGNIGEVLERFSELGITSRSELAKMGVEFSKSGELVSPLEDAFSAITTVMQDKFGGMMDAQSQTFEGMMSNLRDWIGGTIRALGAPIFEVVREKLAILVAWLSSAETKAMLDSFAASFASGIGGAMDFIANTAIPALMTAWNTIQPIIQPVIDMLANNLQPILVGVGVTFGILATAAAVSAATTIAAFLPVAAPFVAIAAVVAALYAAWTSNFGGIQDKTQAFISYVTPIFEDVMETLSQFWTDILPSLQTIWENTSSAVIAIISTLYTAFNENFGGIKATVQSVIAFIVAVISTQWTFISGITKTFLQLLSGDFSGAWNTLKNTLNSTLEGIKGIVSAAWSVIQNATSTAFGIVQSIANTIWNSISGSINGIVDGIKSNVTGKWNEIKTSVSDTVGGIRDSITGAFDKAKGGISDTISDIKSMLSGAWNDIKSGAGSAWSGVASAITSAFSGVYGAIKSEINKLIDGINTLIEGFNSLPGAPQIGKIRRLAAGSVNFAGGMALVGEVGPELVTLPKGSTVASNAATRNMLTEAMSNKSGDTYHINLTLAAGVDRRMVVEAVETVINQKSKNADIRYRR